MTESVARPRKQTAKAEGPQRVDPPSRPLGDLDDWMSLENREEHLHYCWVNKNGGIVGSPPYYRSMGYHVVKYVQGEVAPVGMAEDLREGEPIEQYDCVLMACTLERKRAIDKRGQAFADETESRVIDRKRGPKDLMRNIPGGIMGKQSGEQTIFVKNETGPEESVFG